eukprot:2705296-Prymnesium_polylepis.3
MVSITPATPLYASPPNTTDPARSHTASGMMVLLGRTLGERSSRARVSGWPSTSSPRHPRFSSNMSVFDAVTPSLAPISTNVEAEGLVSQNRF